VLLPAYMAACMTVSALSRVPTVCLTAVLLASTSAQAQAPGAAGQPPAATAIALANAASPTTEWVLGANQEPAAKALFAMPGLAAPTSIRIERDRIQANYPNDRTLVARHHAATAGPGVVAQTPALRVHRVAGEWTAAELAAIASHVKTAKAPRWHPATGKTGATGATAETKPSGDRQKRIDDLLGQASEALEIDERAKARRLLAEAQRAGLRHPSRQVQLGDLLRRAGDEATGLALLRKATAALAAKARVRASAKPLWADALARLDPAAAIKLAHRGVDASAPGRVCDWAPVAYTLQAHGQADSAANIARAILALDPRCERAWLVRGHVVNRSQADWQAVLALANEALAQVPNSLPLLNLKAGALHAGWQSRQAAAVWERIARIDLGYPGVMGMLATAWTQLPDLHNSDFLDPFLQRIARDPKDVVSRYIVGTASYYRHDYDSVLRYLEPLRTVVPREPRVHLYTAMAHFHLGHREVAARRLATLERFGHRDPDFYYCRSLMRRDTDFEGSLRDLEKFVRLSARRQNSPEKVHKMHRELQVMRSGRVPNAFDLLADWLRWSILAAVALLLTAIGWWLLRRWRARA
jgi:tetratricopeptide (TPR) repeat protein